MAVLVTDLLMIDLLDLLADEDGVNKLQSHLASLHKSLESVGVKQTGLILITIPLEFLMLVLAHDVRLSEVAPLFFAGQSWTFQDFFDTQVLVYLQPDKLG